MRRIFVEDLVQDQQLGMCCTDNHSSQRARQKLKKNPRGYSTKALVKPECEEYKQAFLKMSRLVLGIVTVYLHQPHVMQNQEICLLIKTKFLI